MLARYGLFSNLSNCKNIQRNFIQRNFIKHNNIKRNLHILHGNCEKLNIKKEINNHNYYKTVEQYLKIIKLSDVILFRLDLYNPAERFIKLSQVNNIQDVQRISLELAFCLNIHYINNENGLLNIIDLINKVENNDRKKVIITSIKKILTECNYDNNEFSLYIDEIYKLKIDNYSHLKVKVEDLVNLNTSKKLNKLEKLNNLENIDTKMTVYNKTRKIRNPQLQGIFRKQIIMRYYKCIISNMCKSVCEAAHIIPFSETLSFDVDNGILLNNILHKLFDEYYWSINPQTLCVELFIDETNDVYDILKPYENKYIKCLKNYPKSIENIEIHYKKSLDNYYIYLNLVDKHS